MSTFGELQSSVPYWETSPESWDALIIGVRGNCAPGIARVKPKRKIPIDQQKGADTQGAHLVVHGEELPAFEVSLRMWREKHLVLLSYLIKALFPNGRGPSRPMDVYHPCFELHEVRSVIFHEMSGPDESGPGLYTATLSCVKFAPPPPVSALSSPKSSDPMRPMPNALLPGKPTGAANAGVSPIPAFSLPARPSPVAMPGGKVGTK